MRRWLDPAGCPSERPPYAEMAPATRSLHDAVDAHIRSARVPYLHPESPTLMLDMLGSKEVIAWQEGKASFLFMGEGCWSELPHLYARYGTTATAQLLARLRELEGAGAAIVTDSGMQATALVFDALMTPGAHAVILRQVYNKTRTYLEWLAERVRGSVTVVDDGDHEALSKALRPQTALVFAETFTNPLMRAQDPVRLGEIVKASSARLIIDSTIATPWGMKRRLLESADVVLGSGTKALGGQDTDLWGYIATNNSDIANQVMDLVAMRGGILDWRRATAILAGLDRAESAHAERCASATRVARFLSEHPRVAEVFHPSLPDHPDARAIAEHYTRHGSLLSFRVKDADEAKTRHLCDVLATTLIVRYALSFDGLTTKVNHHKTVSEYFTPEEALARNGFDRLVRLAVGTEAPDDIIACLNWMLHHGDTITPDEISQWQSARRQALQL